MVRKPQFVNHDGSQEFFRHGIASLATIIWLNVCEAIDHLPDLGHGHMLIVTPIALEEYCLKSFAAKDERFFFWDDL